VVDLGGLSREELIEHARGLESQLVVVTAAHTELVAAHEQLTAAHEQLLAEHAALAARLAKLEHLLSRNSGNSSMPPSGDDDPGRTPPPGKGRPTPRRAKGKQKGAPGAWLSWSDAPDERADRYPAGVCGCGQDLTGGRDLGVVDSFQQVELPAVRACITQYDQHAVACGCGRVHTAARPAGAGTAKVEYGPMLSGWAVYLMVVHHVPVHRTRQVLTALTGAEPSVGFVHGLLARTAKILAAAHQRIRALITMVRVLVMDETPLRVGSKTPRPGRKKADKYLLIATSRWYTSFLVGDRDLATFKASVLADLTAGTVVVHDRYTVYDHATFAQVSHQLCTAHLLRDLESAAQTYPEAIWPVQIADALRDLIHASNLARAAGADHVDPDTVHRQSMLIRHGVMAGLAATTGHGTRPGEAKARALLETFDSRPGDILRFAGDLNIPPTSNDAERGLRPSKLQQKISGRLVSIARTEDRYRIAGYLATAAQHGHDQFTTLTDALRGTTWMPTTAAIP
jgi:hypothetical protein